MSVRHAIPPGLDLCQYADKTGQQKVPLWCFTFNWNMGNLETPLLTWETWKHTCKGAFYWILWVYFHLISHRAWVSARKLLPRLLSILEPVRVHPFITATVWRRRRTLWRVNHTLTVTPRAILESQTNLSSMLLDSGRNSESLEKTYVWMGEHVSSKEKQPSRNSDQSLLTVRQESKNATAPRFCVSGQHNLGPGDLSPISFLALSAILVADTLWCFFILID